MAPVLTKCTTSYHQPASKIPRPPQSKIPLSKKVATVAAKPKTASVVSKHLNERINITKPIIKPSVIGKSLNGRTNIIKPIIKKNLPLSPAKNIKWTKSTDIQSVSRKSIEKAKDRKTTNLKQSILNVKQNALALSFQKNVDAKQWNVSKNKENKIPNVTISQKELHSDTLPSANTSMKALQDKLNLEFVPNEFFRSQILNNKALSFTQLKEFSNTPLKQTVLSKSITKQMERMTISGSKLQRSTTKVTRLTGSSSKCSKQTPLSAKNPSSQAIRRCTWTPGIQSQTKPVIDPFEEAVNSIRRLSERKSSMSSSKPRARVALFQSAKTNSWSSPEVSRRVTWNGGKKTWGKQLDPFEEAIASIKKLKPKNFDPNAAEERRCTWAPGKQIIAKQFDPYNVAMARIKELKTRTPISAKSSPALFTPAKTPLKNASIQQTPTQKVKGSAASLFRRSLFAAEGGNEDKAKFTKSRTPEHSTPHRVSFNLSTTESPGVYRPLSTLLSKSILKKKPRLTDISEHSENDTTRSSQSSGKESDPYPVNLLKLSGSLDAKFAAVSSTSAIVATTSCGNASNLLKTPKTRSSESIVLTPFSRNSSLPPSSKQRKLTPVLENNSSPFALKSLQFPNDSNVTIKSFFPPVGNFVESTSSSASSSEEPSTPLYTPKPLSYFSPRHPSPEDFFETCCKSTTSHDAPICTPLVLKSIARKNQNRELLSPIKQKLEFKEIEDDVIKPCKEESNWTPRYSTYGNNILTRSKREDLLADRECERYMAKQRGFFSNCRNFINPIAKSLSNGDNMHFLPILPEYNE